MRNEGQVVSRETLARDIWQEPSRTALLGNIIDVYVGRLRRKIDLDGSIELIHTIRGVGFMRPITTGSAIPDKEFSNSSGSAPPPCRYSPPLRTIDSLRIQGVRRSL